MKKFLSLMLVFVLVLGLVACGTTAAPETPPATDAPATDAPVVEVPAVEAPAAEGAVGEIEDGAELVYWTMWNETEPQGLVISDAVAAFEAETGVKVEIQFNGREIRKTLEPALSAGETIDIFDEDIERVLNAWGDYLLPLDSYVDATYSTTKGAPYRTVINNTLLTLAETLGTDKNFADGGKIHNIPYQPSTFIVMYNKDLFDAAGVEALPTTWDEFLGVCEKLKASGVTPITVDDAYIAALFGYNMDRIIGSEKTYEMASTRDFSDPSVLRFGEVWQNMVEKGYVSTKAATNVYPAGQVGEIATGDVAMYLNGTWLPNEIKDNAPDMKWGSFAYPAIDPAGDGPEANQFGAQSFGVNKDTQYPNAAFSLVVWLTTGEWDQKLADESLGVPMANDAQWPAELAEAKTVIDNTTKRLNWAVGMEDDAEVNAAVKDAFARLVTGEYDAAKFAEAMAAVTPK